MWAWIECGSLDAIPGVQRDDVFYDNIAFNLANGNGYSLDFSNEQWLQLYRDNNAGGNHDWIFDLNATGPTATRAPAWPLLMSVVYRTAGRRFDIMRIINIVAMTLGLTFLLCTVYRFCGGVVATFAAVTMALDFAVLRTAGQVMTEAVATAWVAFCFALTIIMFCRSPDDDRSPKQYRSWFLVGIGIGVLSLIRGNANAWIVMIAIAMVALGAFHRGASSSWRFWITRLVLFVLGVAVVAGPWWVRNCQVTGHFEPFGTGGSIGAAGGFSDGALRNLGNWDLATVQAVQQQAGAQHDFSGLTLAEREYRIGLESRGFALEWIIDNPMKLPGLTLGKAFNHLGFGNDFHPAVIAVNVLLLLGALVGFGVRDVGRLAGLVLLISLLTTLLTFSHFGRYSIPVRPLLHVSCAIGVVWICTGPLRRWRGELMTSQTDNCHRAD